MKKTLLPLALFCVPMVSMADVSVYGRAHVSVDWLDNGADYSAVNLVSNGSRLGFKANHVMGDLTAMVQIEQQVDYDAGEAFTSARDTFIGLKGNFGMVRAGRFDTPFKRARNLANLFGDQLGDMRNLTRVGNARFDERNANTLHYQTPALGPVQFNVAYSISESLTNEEELDDDVISLSATFSQGALEMAAAYESYSEDHSRGERDGVRFSARYGVNDALALVAFAQTVDHTDSEALSSDVFGLGSEYKLTTKTLVRGMWLTRSAEADNSDANLVALGVEYRIDKPLRVYANVALADNDELSALTPYTQGRTVSGISAAPGETASGLSVGVRYDF
ncbi:MAG TPA: porin [Cellvibrionaceae bacterium]